MGMTDTREISELVINSPPPYRSHGSSRLQKKPRALEYGNRGWLSRKCPDTNYTTSRRGLRRRVRMPHRAFASTELVGPKGYGSSSPLDLDIGRLRGIR
ncbi:hypothetical protein AAG906_037133 [Vitis piasezkii]